jgi:hypothetical protein
MNRPERLWRVRRDHAWIDAQICGIGRPGRVRVDFFFEGSCIFSREFPSRELAIDDAAGKLRDLQRVGWSTHW